MSDDSYTEVTEQSWGSRISGSLKGIVFGLILIAVSVWLLFSNEGRAVKRAKSLEEGAGVVVSVPAHQVNPANEGKLVHVTGQAETPEILSDPEFGVAANALHLERRVEMYQWKENEDRDTEKKVGGGTRTTTTYSYEKVWSDALISSGSFKQSAEHQNPGSFPYSSRKWSASRVTVGAFRLSPSLLQRLSDFQPLSVGSASSAPTDIQWKTQVRDGGYYVGQDPTRSQIGDLRIRFAYVPPGPVSLVAQQVGSSFSPYQTRAGGTVELLRSGTASADAMFAAAQQSNKVLTWMLRGGGFLLMFFGLSLVFKPLSVAADVLPFLGNLVSAGTGFISFFIALFVSLTVIAVAWLFYRPLLAIVLIALAVAVVVLIVRRVRKVKGKSEPAASAPSEPAVPPPPPPPTEA